VRAVIFDLWETLIDWPREESEAHYEALAEAFGVAPDRFRDVWIGSRASRETGSRADAVRAASATLEVDEVDVDAVVALRREFSRSSILPRPGVVETLKELRTRGYRIGLISVCSEDVPDVWPETELEGLFDATVFSCSVGLAKPDRRIYELACEQLGVEPEDAVFVGDGANDELSGAERAGLKAVLILRPDEEEPPWEDARGWQPRITSIPEILDLLEEEPC
jgi:putative hydrolase of the HAD superfamily